MSRAITALRLNQVDELLAAYRRGENPLETLINEAEAAVRALPRVHFRSQDDRYHRITSTAWSLRALHRALSGRAADEVAAASATVDDSDPHVAAALDKAARGTEVTDRGLVIGYVAVTDSHEVTDASFECAAWYQKHTVHPGAYALVMHGGRLSITFDTTLGGSDFGSRFAGVPIGEGGMDENVGKTGTYTSSTYTFTFPKVYVPGIEFGRGQVFLCPEVSITETRTMHDLCPIPSVRHEITVDRSGQ